MIYSRSTYIINLLRSIIAIIKLPGTVWALATNQNNDIIVGCSDTTIRLFTRDPYRIEKGPDFDAFEADCLYAANA